MIKSDNQTAIRMAVILWKASYVQKHGKTRSLYSANRGKNQGMEILSQIHQPSLHSSVITEHQQ